MLSHVGSLIKITVIAALCSVLGCSTPSARFHAQALRQGMIPAALDSIVTYQDSPLIDGRPIHIYLDGDGAPILRGNRTAQDPTSRDRLILDLIALDQTPSLLVGRPCYYGKNSGCNPRSWTVGRYSRKVVEQIVAVINNTIADYPHSPVTLIGYSGGGTLAMLVAPAMRRLDSIITIAANLDTQAWTELHGYGPLVESLNPADLTPLSASVAQLHLIGAKDENVPVSIVRHVIAKQHAEAVLTVVPDFDHGCCWPRIWAATLARYGAHK